MPPSLYSNKGIFKLPESKDLKALTDKLVDVVYGATLSKDVVMAEKLKQDVCFIKKAEDCRCVYAR
jgi:hypothetical protein